MQDISQGYSQHKLLHFSINILLSLHINFIRGRKTVSLGFDFKSSLLMAFVYCSRLSEYSKHTMLLLLIGYLPKRSILFIQHLGLSKISCSSSGHFPFFLFRFITFCTISTILSDCDC